MIFYPSVSIILELGLYSSLFLRINNECVKNREARISIDLVKDEVENSLEREVENIKTYQQRMQKMLAKVNPLYQSSIKNDLSPSFSR